MCLAGVRQGCSSRSLLATVRQHEADHWLLHTLRSGRWGRLHGEEVAELQRRSPYSSSVGTVNGNPGNTWPSSGLESTNDMLCRYISSRDGGG